MQFSSPRTRRLFAAALAPMIFLAGCAQQSAVPEPAFTAAPVPSQASAPATSAAPETSSESERPAPQCASLPNDPREQYPSGTAPGRMPNVDGTDYNFWIADIENNYDPCAPVSWIIFRGSLGDLRGPAGTGASITDGIAFYINGEPDGEMRTFTRIESVTLAEPDTVVMSWGERTGATAEGITAHYSVTLEADPGGIQAIGGEKIEFTDRWYSPYGMYMLGTYD